MTHQSPSEHGEQSLKTTNGNAKSGIIIERESKDQVDMDHDLQKMTPGIFQEIRNYE